MKSKEKRPRLVIHTGDPKTGTTTVQRVLHDRLVTCPSQEILPWTHLNAIAVAESLKSRDGLERKRQFRRVKNWLARSDADVAVISSEFFAAANPAVLRTTVEKYLPGDSHRDLRVISYVRPHASRFLAAFVQRTKTGQYFGEIDELLAMLKSNESLTFLYSKRFPMWQQRFGSHFILRPFVRSELRGGDISEDFFEQVLDGAPFEIAKRVEVNIGVSTTSLAGMRRMHQRFTEIGVAPKNRSLVGGAMGNHYLGPMKAGSEKPKLDQETAKQLISTFRADAKKLDAAFFGKPLMLDELRRCTDDTRDTKIDLNAEAHFTPAELKSLDELSISFAKDFKRVGRLWALHYDVTFRKAKNYMIPPIETLIALRPVEKKVRSMDEKLFAISDILRK